MDTTKIYYISLAILAVWTFFIPILIKHTTVYKARHVISDKNCICSKGRVICVYKDDAESNELCVEIQFKDKETKENKIVTYRIEEKKGKDVMKPKMLYNADTDSFFNVIFTETPVYYLPDNKEVYIKSEMFINNSIKIHPTLIENKDRNPFVDWTTTRVIKDIHRKKGTYMEGKRWPK